MIARASQPCFLDVLHYRWWPSVQACLSEERCGDVIRDRKPLVDAVVVVLAVELQCGVAAAKGVGCVAFGCG